VVFTDIGGDVDDAAALVLMAITDPQLALVDTVDEYPDHRRARSARHLLDVLARSDVRVVAGLSLGASGYWAADGLVPADIEVPPGDLYDVMSELCEAGSKSVRCLSLGPLTDIARLLVTDAHRSAPLDSERLLRVTAMGGALNYRNPERAGHNWRMNPASVQTVLAETEHVALVLSDHTPSTRSRYLRPRRCIGCWTRCRERRRSCCGSITTSSSVASTIRASSTTPSPRASCWGRGSCRGVGEFELRRDGRMREGPGTRAWLSDGVDYTLFMAWMEQIFRDVPQ
jgi:hypothetical protein